MSRHPMLPRPEGRVPCSRLPLSPLRTRWNWRVDGCCCHDGAHVQSRGSAYPAQSGHGRRSVSSSMRGCISLSVGSCSVGGKRLGISTRSIPILRFSACRPSHVTWPTPAHPCGSPPSTTSSIPCRIWTQRSTPSPRCWALARAGLSPTRPGGAGDNLLSCRQRSLHRVVASGQEPALIGLALKTPDLAVPRWPRDPSLWRTGIRPQAGCAGRADRIGLERAHLNWGLALMGTLASGWSSGMPAGQGGNRCLRGAEPMSQPVLNRSRVSDGLTLGCVPRC